MTWLNIADIIPATEAEGPGLRFVIWVQGCLKRCKGCCNVEMLKIQPAQFMQASEIIDLIQKTMQSEPLEGITILGGEPMLQAPGLAEVAQAVQEFGLSVMIFTGYLKEELIESKFKGSTALLSYTDVLVDGEFEQENAETIRNWVGSTNQRFHYLSERYSPEIETRDIPITNEFRINLDGQIIGNGLPFKIKSIID